MKYVLIILLSVSSSLFSQVPDYNFIVEPTELINSYFDYMPGGYNNIPIQIQPEVSFPNNYPAGGIYIAFQAKETSFAERFVYFSYINSLGEIVSTDVISPCNYRQGYPSIDINPFSCDPICC